FPDCGKYFVNTSIEDNAIYKSVSEPEMKFIWYLPNGTIRFKEKSKKFTFFIDINDPTYNNLNEPDDFIINVFDSDYLANKDKSPDYIEYLNTQNQYYITQGKDVENITNVLGTISAIYGSMFAIYLFLFKKDLSSGEPYGLIYDFYNKDKKKVKKQNDE
ncbi:7127_t:CDS:2, partial [Gigaspora rosea]